MGVIVNKKNNENDELTRRINADLRERMQSTGLEDSGEVTDFTENSEYMKDMEKTSKFGWVWVVLIVLAILSIISIVFF